MARNFSGCRGHLYVCIVRCANCTYIYTPNINSTALMVKQLSTNTLHTHSARATETDTHIRGEKRKHHIADVTLRKNHLYNGTVVL